MPKYNFKPNSLLSSSKAIFRYYGTALDRTLIGFMEGYEIILKANFKNERSVKVYTSCNMMIALMDKTNHFTQFVY